MAALSAAAVANEFLDLAKAEGLPIDPMKLQKLVFYAHAWWLAHKGEALFEDDIEAWPWGPVVRNLYTQFLEFGRHPIVGKRAKEIMKGGSSSVLAFRFVDPRIDDVKLKSFLKSIWETHKNYSGVQLSNATHADGEPWTIVKEKYGSLDSKPRIPNEVIRDVFKAKLNAA
ncbi:MAG: DUF4065 domain-containing protein [Alsobacter sp.]